MKLLQRNIKRDMLRKNCTGWLFGFFGWFFLFYFVFLNRHKDGPELWILELHYKAISLVTSSSERKIICYRLLREEQKPNHHYAITQYLLSHLECCMNIQSCHFKKDIEGLERTSEKGKRMKRTRNSFIIRCK